jgi:ER membrane protein complex subunit 4
MNLLIMYMAGNSISIFPIMMVGMSLIRPLKAIFTTGATFKSFETVQQNIVLQKLVFFIGNLINIGLALYKCHSMGLLPTHASDWLAFVEPPLKAEWSDGGMSLL